VTKALTHQPIGDMKYPLFQHIVLIGSYAPYMLYLKISGGLSRPGASYPYGFVDPAAAIQTLTLIARGVTLLMAAGLVVVAYFTAKRLWNRTAGLLAALFVMLMYPMNYYGIMSNVDVPSLFWASLVLWVSIPVMRGGWTMRSAIGMGIFAALSIATKDQSYAVVLLLPLALIPFHLRAASAKGQADFWRVWKAPLAGLIVSAVVYGFMSGMLISPTGFRNHLKFISTADVQGVPSFWYFRYDASWSGYMGVLRESFQQIVDTQGWILFLTGCAGIVLCMLRDRSRLIFLVTIPILIIGVILPVRHTAIRFLLPVGYVLALYAAYLLASAWHSQKRGLQVFALLVLVSGSGLQLWRAWDLLQVMNDDTRTRAAAWLARLARPGTKVEFFELASDTLSGRINKLPAIPPGVKSRNASVLFPIGGKMDGEFVIAQGPDDMSWHWYCPAWVYQGLLDGRLGYDLAADFQSRGGFSHEHLVLVSPRVQIFVRKDQMAALGIAAATTSAQITPFP
jgi:dolichyl-phosphate-mannose-protein mannosyltransferase